MDDFLSWLVIVVVFGMATRSLGNARRNGDRLRLLTDRLDVLEDRMTRFGERPAGDVPQAREDESPDEAAPAATPTPAPAPAIGKPGVGDASAMPLPPSIPPAVMWHRAERILVENWLVWLGGVTLALGGAFLVKLSIEHGLLKPAVRVVLGVLLGVGLVAAAERAARREATSASSGAFHVPQALAAAGSSTIFASLYAAHQLYGLLPASLAFALLAASAGATVALSLRHGPLVAALGLLGAFAVPALVGSDAPHAAFLFGYLALATAGSLALLRHRAWPWLAWIALAGGMVWVLAWLISSEHRADTPAVTAFLLVELLLFAGFRRGVPRIGFLAGPVDAPVVRGLIRAAFWTIAAAIFLTVRADGDGAIGLAGAVLAGAFMMRFAFRDPALDDLLAAPCVLAPALLAAWHLQPDGQIARFALVAAIFALLLGGGGFAALARVERPGRWAAASAAVPQLILAVAYWRLHRLAPDFAWSAAALALAGLELAAAARVARRRDGGLEIEIALYAAGVLSGTILAASFALSEAWLTVALALQLPALGWCDGHFRLKVLRRLALAIAGAVLARLALNPEIVSYPLGDAPLFNWMLYGYGVPTLAFVVATRQFGSRADDLLVAVLEAGSVVFAFFFVTLELQHALYGALAVMPHKLGGDASLTASWLALCALILKLGERRRRPVLRWGGIALFAIATAHAVVWQAAVADPLVTGKPVGRLILLDALTLAYLMPTLLYAAIAALRLGPLLLRQIARLLALAFAFLWLSLEIRHVFRGEVLSWGVVSEGEWYAYSAAWLACAATAFAVSLYLQNDWLRRAALIVIGLIVVKVFLFDMAALTGLLRALSFLGLGFALIGIGYVYRRLLPSRSS